MKTLLLALAERLLERLLPRKRPVPKVDGKPLSHKAVERQQAQIRAGTSFKTWPSCAPDCRLPHIHDRTDIPATVTRLPSELMGDGRATNCPQPSRLKIVPPPRKPSSRYDD